MYDQILTTLYFVAGFISIIFFCELLHRHFSVNAEYTRKIAHILACLSSLAFIVLFESHWYVLFLAVVSFVVLLTGKRNRFTKSIDGVARPTGGSYILPISVYMLFFISEMFNNQYLFILPMLILAISDPLAGLSGIYFQGQNGEITLAGYKTGKTILGSFMFFSSALILSLVSMTHFMDDPLRIIALSVMLAGISSFVELISPNGTDNLTVPASIAIFLMLI